MKKILKRGMSGLLAVLMAFTVLAGFGTTTAFAASETAESYMISFPRDGDAAQIYSEDAWGHSAKTYMNGWTTGSSNYTTLHCMDSFDGKVCYCIEPGLSRNVGDTYHGFGEDFWDNYPSQYNNTIEPDDIKLPLGRIMQYGYQGNLSTSWRSQNDSDADKLAHAFATQLLVWETVVGERDADFDHVSTGGYGFGSRVEWCACFVSWCANECGYIDTGVIPKFAGCVNGVQWFRERGQWADNAMEPSPGMIIFFDWDNRGSSGPQDGQADHVGIVQKVENGVVYTIEGNSGDSCRVNQYPLGYYEILGYGVVAY